MILDIKRISSNKNENCVDLIYLDKDNIFMEFMVENKRGDFVKTSTVFNEERLKELRDCIDQVLKK
tara:strand:- start:395 stop:592 length:198 start_codon:yes stop_codon:yes gene_type:complete